MFGVVVLICLPFLLVYALGLVYGLVRAWLDRRLPDDLPHVAGAWAEQQLRERLPDVKVAVGARDCYSPKTRLVVLTDETYRKADPSFWAVAAHEVGHALWHARAPAFSSAMSSARRLGELTGSCVRLMLIINFAYASRAVDDVACVLLVATLALAPLVLADELMASAAALWLLRHDAAMVGARFAAAVVKLAAAFATYLASAVAHAWLLYRFEHVRAVVERHAPAAGAPLSAWRWTVVLVLTALLVVRVVFQVRLMLRPPAMPIAPPLPPERLRPRASWSPSLPSLPSAPPLPSLAWPWELPCALLVLLVWNQPLGTPFVFCVILALMSTRRLMILPYLPLVVVMGVAMLLVKRFADPWLQGESLRWQARQLSTRDAEARVRYASERLRPDWLARAGQLVDLLFIPLVVRVWLAAVGY
jgi:Zn-dependent membrane protease YugP